MASKNEPVGGHAIDLLLDCGCVVQEPCEAAIYAPSPGEGRYCTKHKREVKVQKVGTMYWVDKK